jgi:hypothetical protein
MDRWDVILPLVLAALVAYVVVAFVRRAARALAQARELERYVRETAAVAANVDATLGRLITRVDAVRRGQVAPGEAETDLADAALALEADLEAATAVEPPSGLPKGAPNLGRDVERALRALEMVSHGCRVASGAEGRRQGELEAQTSIKRGYLNLLHAREAFLEHASDAAATRAEAARKWRASRI